ncbi:MAG: hypothetical protein ACOCV8_01890 [Spirochaetota bacterium]
MNKKKFRLIIYSMFILIFLSLSIQQCSSSNNTQVRIDEKSANKNNVTNIKSELLTKSDIPSKMLSFVSVLENNEKIKEQNEYIDYLIKDYNYLNLDRSKVVFSSRLNIYTPEKNNITRINSNYLKIRIPTKYCGKYSAFFLGEKIDPMPRFEILFKNNKVVKNKYFLYIQGTNPIVETKESIAQRPVINLLSNHYKKGYVYLYYMGANIDYKTEQLYQYIKDLKKEIPEDAMIDVIGESQGALIGRALLTYYPELQNSVNKFISLCGPNEGSYIANDYYIANMLEKYIFSSTKYKTTKKLYLNWINALNSLVFLLMPELIDLREGSDFLTKLNKNMSKEIADKMYFIAGTLFPENENWGDLIVKPSSALFYSCNYVKEDRRFLYPYNIHAQVIMSPQVAIQMYNILIDKK